MAIQAYEMAKSAHKRLDEQAKEIKDIHDLAVAMSAMSEKVDGLSADMQEVKSEVQKVTGQPGQRWDKLVTAIIGAVAAGLVGAILALILK